MSALHASAAESDSLWCPYKQEWEIALSVVLLSCILDFCLKQILIVFLEWSLLLLTTDFTVTPQFTFSQMMVTISGQLSFSTTASWQTSGLQLSSALTESSDFMPAAHSHFVHALNHFSLIKCSTSSFPPCEPLLSCWDTMQFPMQPVSQSPIHFWSSPFYWITRGSLQNAWL